MSFQNPQHQAMKGHLISLVQEKRGLWTTNKNYYRNKMLKINDWQSVFEKMKEKYSADLLNKNKMSNTEEIKKLWLSMKNYYRTLLRGIKGPGSSGKGASGKQHIVTIL